MEKRVGIAEDRTGTYFPAESPPRSEAGLVRRGAAPSAVTQQYGPRHVSGGNSS